MADKLATELYGVSPVKKTIPTGESALRRGENWRELIAKEPSSTQPFAIELMKRGEETMRRIASHLLHESIEHPDLLHNHGLNAAEIAERYKLKMPQNGSLIEHPHPQRLIVPTLNDRLACLTSIAPEPATGAPSPPPTPEAAAEVQPTPVPEEAAKPKSDIVPATDLDLSTLLTDALKDMPRTELEIVATSLGRYPLPAEAPSQTAHEKLEALYAKLNAKDVQAEVVALIDENLVDINTDIKDYVKALRTDLGVATATLLGILETAASTSRLMRNQGMKPEEVQETLKEAIAQMLDYEVFREAQTIADPVERLKLGETAIGLLRMYASPSTKLGMAC